MSEASPTNEPLSGDPGAAFEPADPPVIVAGLSQLLTWSKAIVLVPFRQHAPVGADGCNWVVDGYEESTVLPIAANLRARLSSEGPLGYIELPPEAGRDEAWSLWAE